MAIVRANVHYLIYMMTMIFFLLLLYRLSTLRPQIKALFSSSFIVITTILGMFLAIKALRSKSKFRRVGGAEQLLVEEGLTPEEAKQTI